MTDFKKLLIMHSMKEYREASKIINNYANENANIKIGVCPKEELKDEIIVTIVATGFDANAKNSFDSKDDDENANDRFNINRSLNSSSVNNVSKIDNSNSNETVNKVLDKDKIISSSDSRVENISEIDNINTMIKEPEEEKEVELESLNVNKNADIHESSVKQDNQDNNAKTEEIKSDINIKEIVKEEIKEIKEEVRKEEIDKLDKKEEKTKIEEAEVKDNKEYSSDRLLIHRKIYLIVDILV